MQGPMSFCFDASELLHLVANGEPLCTHQLAHGQRRSYPWRRASRTIATEVATDDRRADGVAQNTVGH